MSDGQPIPADARCLGCGYALRDLPTPRCPECGLAFDPDRPATMGPRDTSSAAPVAPDLIWLATVAGWVVLSLAVMAGVARLLGTGDLVDGALPVIAVPAVFATSFVRRLAPAGPFGSTTPRRRRVAWVALFALALMAVRGGPVAYSCPHGQQWGFCGLGLAQSTVGGPCRNCTPHLRSAHLFGDWYVWRG